MSYNAEGSSSAATAPIDRAVNPPLIDYRSMLRSAYPHQKETEEVMIYLEGRRKKPIPAAESATIIEFRTGTGYESVHYSSQLNEGTGPPQFSSAARAPWADAFQQKVESADDSVFVRLVLVSKVSCGFRSISFWIINYLGWYFKLEPGFFYPLIDADGDCLPEDNKARARPLRPSTLYMEDSYFALCSVKRERMLVGSKWRPQVSELDRHSSKAM